MNNKVYVGGLPYAFTQEQLEELFAEHKFDVAYDKEAGEQNPIQLVIDRFTNQSRGFAFVTLKSEEEAQRCINELNTKEVGGRTLTVNIARPKEDRGDRPQRSFNRSDHGGSGAGNGHSGDRGSYYSR